MTDNTKMREAFEKWATDKGYNIERWIYGRHLYANRLTQNAWEVWQAAQSPAVPVVERNQCDGCNRGLQVCDDGLHREPSGHPVMACTRNKYTHSIPATELASLREKAAMVDELRKDAERYRWLREQSWDAGELCIVSQPKHAVKLGHDCPSLFRLDAAIDAAIAQGKGE